MTILDLEKLGYTSGGEVMPNGERRIRFRAPDDTAYIRTEAGADGGWQNAHFHKGVRETYIVQSGTMIFATIMPDGSYGIVVYKPGEVVSSEPGTAHNVFLPTGAVIHTVKHGVAVGNPDKGAADWWPADDGFDRWTKNLSERMAFEMAKNH